jgi:hypothetical protein
MGIHISCDNCYKQFEGNDDFVTISIKSDSSRFPFQHKNVYCYKCMKDVQYIYMSAKNPNYIAPPPKPEDEVVKEQA